MRFAFDENRLEAPLEEVAGAAVLDVERLCITLVQPFCAN